MIQKILLSKNQREGIASLLDKFATISIICVVGSLLSIIDLSAIILVLLVGFSVITLIGSFILRKD